MEVELNYASITFNNTNASLPKKKEEETIYADVQTKGSLPNQKSAEASATQDKTVKQQDSKEEEASDPHCQLAGLVPVCLTILCVLLMAAIIALAVYLSSVLSEVKQLKDNSSSMLAARQELMDLRNNYSKVASDNLQLTDLCSNLSSENQILHNNYSKVASENHLLTDLCSNLSSDNQILHNYSKVASENHLLTDLCSNLSSENQILHNNYSKVASDNHQLKRQNLELSKDRDGLNWTLQFILQFDNFPVEDYCPQKPGNTIERDCKPCLNGWMLFQSSCYQFYTGGFWRTWDLSQRNCQRKNADLVVIGSQDEQEFISNHIAPYYAEYHGYWIGLRYSSKHGRWLWVDGSNLTAGYWVTGGAGKGHSVFAIPQSPQRPSITALANWDKPWGSDMKNRWICEIKAFIRSD